MMLFSEIKNVCFDMATTVRFMIVLSTIWWNIRSAQRNYKTLVQLNRNKFTRMDLIDLPQFMDKDVDALE